ncbi:hypothetical protein V6Z11_A11G288900 [Gossypium hirsutum]
MLLNELGANGRNKEGKTNQELQFFSLETIAHATNNFAATNGSKKIFVRISPMIM